MTIGPTVENGFYYDFASARPFTPEDLKAIDVRIQELIKQDIPVERFTLSRDEAVESLQSFLGRKNIKPKLLKVFRKWNLIVI